MWFYQWEKDKNEHTHFRNCNKTSANEDWHEGGNSKITTRIQINIQKQWPNITFCPSHLGFFTSLFNYLTFLGPHSSINQWKMCESGEKFLLRILFRFAFRLYYSSMEPIDMSGRPNSIYCKLIGISLTLSKNHSMRDEGFHQWIEARVPKTVCIKSPKTKHELLSACFGWHHKHL